MTEALVVVADTLVYSHDLAALRGRIAGWKAARGRPAEASADAGLHRSRDRLSRELASPACRVRVRQDARRPEPRLPRARRDRRHGDVRAGADPGASAASGPSCGSRRSSTARRRRRRTARGASSSRRSPCPCARASAGSGCAASSSSCPGLRSAPASTSSTASPARRPRWGAFRRVVTIHDVIYRRYPEAHQRAPRARRCACWSRSRPGARIASSLPREATQDDLVRLLGISAAKIDVVPLGLGVASRPTVDGRARARRALRPRRRDPFVLTVSAKRPHKNLMRLLDALAMHPGDRGARFSSCPATRRRTSRSCGSMRIVSVSRPTRAFSAGSPTTSSKVSTGVRRASSFRRSTRGSGSRSSRRWPGVYRSRARDRGALAEVVDGAALTFDPEQPTEIADAIERLLEDPRRARPAARCGPCERRALLVGRDCERNAADATSSRSRACDSG